MNKPLRFLSILAILIFASSYSYAQDSDYDMEVDGIYYKVNTDELTALVVRAPYQTPYTGNLTIPATVTRGRFTFNVVAINQGAFNNTGNLESVTILSNGTNGVFYIADDAFAYNRTLKKVVLPNTLQAIGTRAFISCTALQSIVIPSSVEEIGLRAFNGCSSLASITFPDEMPLKAIGDEAFYGCGITTLTLPKGVKQAGKEAFAKCKKLTKVNFADDYQVISELMFAECSSLEEITFPSSVVAMNSMAFYCCPLKKVVIPSTIKYMPWDAFLYCEKLTEFVILDSEEELSVWNADDDEDFTNLKTLYLGRNLNYIDDGIMKHLNPSQLSIGPKVTTLLNCFGDGIQEITSYIIDPTSVPENFSKKVKANAVLKVPAASYDFYCNAKGWKDFFFIEKMAGKPDVGSVHNLTVGNNELAFKVTNNYPMEVEVSAANQGQVSGALTIPKTIEIDGYTYSVTSIGEQAFIYCRDLTSVTIPNSVTSIGGFAFCYCSGLTSVTIPKSVTSIGIAVFVSCSLTSIIVESGNTTYDSRNKCNAIIETKTNKLIAGCKNTIIPNSVTSIEWGAFNNCIGLTSVTIPNSVTSIGDHSFEWCTDLTSVTIGNSVTSIGDAAFASCKGLTSVSIGNSVTSIGDGAFTSCKGLTSVTIGNSVISVGDGAFQYCSSLTTVTIGNSVTSIGKCAFFNTMLQHVYCYAEQVPWVDADAFPGSIRKATLHVPAGSVNAYKNTSPWSYFGNIVALENGDPSGIEAIKNGEQKDNAPVYNLNGQHVDTPQKGIYIKNGRKVLMK